LNRSKESATLDLKSELDPADGVFTAFPRALDGEKSPQNELDAGL
jgi:hypothetical protein